MKRIEAIIRKTKFDEVKNALHEADIDFFSFWEVRGIGQARQGRVYRGIVYDTGSIERLLLSIVVRDVNVQKTVDAILNSAKTGEIGDGRIFILPVENVYRIRTGEEGDETLYIKEEEKLK